MIIDGHSHVTLPIQNHIELMDKVGVAKTILFSTSIHPEKAENFTDLKGEMQRLNEILLGSNSALSSTKIQAIKELKEVIKDYPSRYIGFGPVPAGLKILKL